MNQYEKIVIPQEKIEALILFLQQVALGPQEAIGMLHSAIRIISDLPGQPFRSAEQLGQELTACLLMAEGQMQ